MAAPAYAAVLLATVLVIYCTIHEVPEGWVAVYYRGGALLDHVVPSGFAFKLPFITTVSFVQTMMQTDEVTNIPCGTRGGVLIFFDKIEVVNQLAKDHVLQTTRSYGLEYDKVWIFDKIHHEINQFCSRHTLQEVYIDHFDTIDESLQTMLQEDCKKYDTGIDIISVRVTKPKIPESVRKNYETMEAEKTRLMVTVVHERVVEMEATADSMRAMIEAEKIAEVSRIQKLQELEEMNAAQNISLIQDRMHLAHEKAVSDAETYTSQVEGDAYKQLLTPQYLELQNIKAMSRDTSVTYGDSIPQSVLKLTTKPE